MKVLVLLTLTAAAFAEPDVSLGYRYQIPSTSYGTPISPADSSLANPTRQYYHVGSLPNAISPTPPATVYQTPIREYSSFTSGLISGRPGISGRLGEEISSSTDFGSSGISGSLSGRVSKPVATFTSSSGISGTGSLGGSSGISGTTGSITTSVGGSRISSSGQTGFNSFDSRGSFQQQSAEVQRHLYFYAAPEEQEEVHQRVNIPVVTPKKNVKVIFIKAPTYRAPAPVQIPTLPQHEEKTVVYVLVKKPDEQAEIDIPAPLPTKPSKPEVYFIKYKTQQDAQEVISNVQNGLVASGVGANSVEGDQDFINTIGQDVSSSSRDNGVALTSLPNSFDERSNIGGTVVSDGGSTASRGGFGVGTLHSVSSTTSSLEAVNAGSGTSGGSGIHQLYGPPK